MDYQKKVDMKEVKEIQKQTTEIAKILKKEDKLILLSMISGIKLGDE